jgi:hypothetical protein
VLIVLFGAAGRQNSPLDLPLFQALAHMAPGQFPQPYFLSDHFFLSRNWLTLKLEDPIMQN